MYKNVTVADIQLGNRSLYSLLQWKTVIRPTASLRVVFLGDLLDLLYLLVTLMYYAFI